MITEHFYGPGEPTPSVDPREMLRGSLNTIHQQPDTGLMPAELAGIDAVCDQVEAFTGDDSTAKAQAWRRAAAATKRLLRDHSEDVKAEWIAAYSDLPPMCELPDDLN